MNFEPVMSEKEKLTAIVYGDTFALYDEKSFDEFIEPLKIRFAANSISLDVFHGQRCLDAGCGGGRGSILMAECGAREVVGVDLSPKNVESSRKRAAQKGFKNLHFQQGSLIEIPFEDESFDIVWCNGVLHHTQNPDKGLKEITRVLKPGGRLWLYLYGSGGIYWFVVDWIRSILYSTNVMDCIYALRLMNSPIPRIGEWIDDWYAPYLRRYTPDDVSKRLDELGYDDTSTLIGGTMYDTSQRRIGASDQELHLMGCGDVRYFCTKVRPPLGDQHALPDPPDGKGSPYTEEPEVLSFRTMLSQISVSLDRLKVRAGHDILMEKIMVCRSIHSYVRGQLETGRPFDSEMFRQHLANVDSIIDRLECHPS